VKDRFWPVADASQADYEALRLAVLDGGEPPSQLAAARFARRGLAGVIAWPQSEPDFLGSLIGAHRPPWSGSEDPREAALCEVYGFLIARRSIVERQEAVGQ